MITQIKYRLYKLIAFFFKYIPHGVIRRKFVHHFRFHIIKGYLAKYDLKKGDIVIDGGAFDGFFTFYAAEIVGDEGKVIAFEPNQTHFKTLVKQKLKKKYDNVILINKGLWCEEGLFKLKTKSSGEYMEASFYFDKDNESKIMTVSVTSLDQELRKIRIEKVDYIKMDIEGAEIEAIKGAKNLLKNNNINLAIASYHIIDGEKTYIKLEKILKEYGYKTYTSFPVHLTTYAWKL